MTQRYGSLIGLVLLLASPCALAQAVVADQGPPVLDLTVGGLSIGDSSAQRLAQTVTVGLGGELLGVLLPIVCDSGRLVIEIRGLNGETPDGPLLQRRRFDAAEVPYVGPNLRLFRTGGGLVFAPGDRFAIVLHNPTGACGMFQGVLGDPYERGAAFFEALPNPPGWVPFAETETRDDLPFLTLMRLPSALAADGLLDE